MVVTDSSFVMSIAYNRSTVLKSMYLAGSGKLKKKIGNVASYIYERSWWFPTDPLLVQSIHSVSDGGVISEALTINCNI